MSITGYMSGGQVATRRVVKMNAAGKVVHAMAADATGATVGNSPAIGITQAQSRGAAGTPWALGWTGTPTASTPTGYPLAATEADQEVHVWDKDGQECEAECMTPASADIDAGANTLTAGGPIIYGDKLTWGDNGVLIKLNGAGYYVAVALFDAAQVALVDTKDLTIGMVRIEKGYRAA